MRAKQSWIWGIIAIGISTTLWAGEPSPLFERANEIKEDIFSDYKNFYSPKNLGLLGAGLGVGAVFANTSLDGDIRDRYQEDVRSETTDHVSQAITGCG